MQSVFEKKEFCYGCTACRNICPKNAIHMKRDEQGFEYPVIDSEKCVDCKLCKKVCPFNKLYESDTFEQKYYAVQHKNKGILKLSSSGGMFFALANAVLKSGGIVYGAAFDKAFSVHHDRAVNIEQAKAFMGSKYVQSSMENIMNQILRDLEAGSTVLFTGTPCQVAGVRSLVLEKRKTLEGLVLCDFICHGAASPAVWESYVRYLNHAHTNGLTFYSFRGKKDGWHRSQPIIVSKEEDISDQYRKKNSFFIMYRTCCLDRPSCYSCEYTSYQRVSDITLGDFWNIGSVCPQMDDNTGTSQVLINTKAGETWFEACVGNLEYRKCTKQDVWQLHLEYPTSAPKQRIEKFWNMYRKKSFEDVLKQYGKESLEDKLKHMAVFVAKKTGLYKLAGKAYNMVFVRRKKDGENL